MQSKNASRIFNDESFINYCLNRNAHDILYWENWIKEHPHHRRDAEEQRILVILMAQEIGQQEVSKEYGRLKKRIDRSKLSKGRFNLRHLSNPFKIGIAASFLIISSIGYYMLHRDNSRIAHEHYDIKPGENKAVLILSNGQQISLGNAKNGVLAVDSKTRIVKTKSGQIIYTSAAGGNAFAKSSFNTIVTPKGGQFNVQLPDGTVVWLNAASTLRYSTNFSGQKQRLVELTGEAYFEVKHLKNSPFVVRTSMQTIEDIGTKFNVNSYQDEPATKTTLIEGAIRVNNSILLPGQQSLQIKNKAPQISAVNIEDVMAWKEGYFNFHDEKIQDVMREIARWYNVDVEYQGIVTNDGFVGKISRYKNISQILKRLETTELVHFKIEGRRVIVMQ